MLVTCLTRLMTKIASVHTTTTTTTTILGLREVLTTRTGLPSGKVTHEADENAPMAVQIANDYEVCELFRRRR
jgi:hypothetical protein